MTFSAQALATDGTAITNPVIGWTVDDATIATVDAHGVVQPTSKGGAVKVRASTLNGKFAEAPVTFVTAPASLAVQSGGDQTAMAFDPLPANVVVKVRDGNGNGVPGVAVNVAATTGGGTTDVASGTSDASGLVTVKWTLGGDLGAQSITATATPMPNAPITINATATERPASALAFSQPPSKSLMGAAITPAVKVNAVDDHGRAVTGFTGSVTIAFETNPKSATLGGTLTANAVAGVATFADLSVSAAGKGYKLRAGNPGLTTVVSGEFDVDQVPSGLSLFSGGSQTAAIRSALTPVAVKVADANGIGVSNVTVTFAVASGAGSIALVNNGVTDLDGIARATWTLGDSIGTQSIRAASNGLNGSPLTITATATPLPAVGLAFVQGPSNVPVNAAISPAVTVKAVNADGQTVTSFTGNIELVLVNNPNGATLGGTKTVAAVNGVATFSNLTVSVGGSGYALKAAATNLTTVTSGTFVVSSPPATALAFQVQPSNTVTGNTISPAMTVRVIDANGNTVPGATNTVTLAFTSLFDASLGGTKVVDAVNGVATFNAVTIIGTGNGYTLKATSPGLTQGTSSAFNVTVAPLPTKTWTGATSSDWHTAGNWSPSAVPTSSDSVVIPTATNAPAIAAAVSASKIVIQSGGVLTVNTAVTFNGQTLSILGGGTLVAQASTTVSGTLSVASSATLRVIARDADNDFIVTSGFTNNGTIELTSSGLFRTNIEVDNSGILTNAAGATIKALGGFGGERRITGILDNRGSIVVAGDSYLSLTTSSLDNKSDGTITLQDASAGSTAENLTSFRLDQGTAGGGSLQNAGTISIGANRAVYVSAGTTLTNASAGVIGGTGSLRVDAAATYTNSGTLAPGGQGVVGTMTFEGNLNVGSGTIEIDVANNTPGTFDVLNVTGGITLSGTLKVKYVGTPTFSSAALNVIHPGSFPSGLFAVFDAPVELNIWSYSFVGNDLRIQRILGY